MEYVQDELGLKGDYRNKVAENYKHCVDLKFEDIPEDAGALVIIVRER